MMRNESFAVFILTHGRPDNVLTHAALRNCGYTGRICVVVDDKDKTLPEYRRRFGDEVVVFNKDATIQRFDEMDNFEHQSAVLYARNFSFELARRLGISHFCMTDDDFPRFEYMFGLNREYCARRIKNLDGVFDAVVDFQKACSVDVFAFSQGGDLVGGASGPWRQKAFRRKAMNTMFYTTKRPLRYRGKMNEDTTFYTEQGSRGKLVIASLRVRCGHVPSQQAEGGMTDIYKATGTYTKAMYTAMSMPSAVSIEYSASMGRIHHYTDWNKTVPKIVPEGYRR